VKYNIFHFIYCYILREEKEPVATEATNEELSLPSEERKTLSDSAEGEDGSEEGSESEKSNTSRDFVMV